MTQRHQIIEIGFDISNEEEFQFLEQLLTKINIPYYIEPQRENPYNTLEELEADCGGK